MNLKKVSEPIDDPSKEEQKPKKTMEKRPLQMQEKKLIRPHGLKKHQYYLNLLTQTRKKKKKGLPKIIKGKKYLLCWG